MSEFWQQFLTQVVVSLAGGIFGGGIISAYLNWRRFQREQAKIEKEQQRVAVDSIRSMVRVVPWKIEESMSDKEKLYIYEHSLQGSVLEYAIVAEFVIRNLTEDETIVTRIEAEEPGLSLFDFWLPSGDSEHKWWSYPDVPFVVAEDTGFSMYDTGAFYDWKTHKEISAENITLKPREGLAVARVSVRRFCAVRRLDAPPKSITIAVYSTGGHKVTAALDLAEVQFLRQDKQVDKYTLPKGSAEWLLEALERTRAKAKAAAEIAETEEEIPF